MAQTIPFTDSRWETLNPEFPLQATPSEDGLKLTHSSVGGTDWWRTTERHSMDGPTLGFWREIGAKGFEVSVELNVSPKVQFDQACIFLYVSPTQWVKAGIEFDAGAEWNGAVVCNPYSDWSIAKRSPSDSRRYTLAFTPNELHIYLGDDMIREVKWFGPTVSNDTAPDAPGGAGGKVFIGVMACSPKAGGAEVVWNEFTVKEGVRPSG